MIINKKQSAPVNSHFDTITRPTQLGAYSYYSISLMGRDDDTIITNRPTTNGMKIFFVMQA